MNRDGSQPRASPVLMPDRLRQLISEAYPDDVLKCVEFVTIIERHLEWLNQAGLYLRAREFLEENEATIREQAEQIKKEKRRAKLRVVSGIVATALATGLVDFVLRYVA